MIFVSHYDSPLGILYLAADEEALKGVWFEGQKYFASGLKENGTEEKETPVLKRTREWLDLYFAGKDPEFLPPLAPDGSEFRKEVWKLLLTIPYGKTMTYGEIGRKIAEMTGKKHIPLRPSEAQSATIRSRS